MTVHVCSCLCIPCLCVYGVEVKPSEEKESDNTTETSEEKTPGGEDMDEQQETGRSKVADHTH